MTAEMMTGQGMILGTPGYLSPEQARGQEVDKRADIWAFGVVLYEMLTGGRLFEGETAPEALAEVLTHEPDLDRVPAKMRKLLASCLEKDPKRRLRDIGDAWRLVEETTVSAVRPPNKVWAAAAGRALALVAAAAGAGWWQASRSGDHPLMRYALDLGADAIAGSDADIAISPDGQRIVFAVRRLTAKPSLPRGCSTSPKPLCCPELRAGTGVFRTLANGSASALTACSADLSQGGAPSGT
jgi:serine/threonine-protein kinase